MSFRRGGASTTSTATTTTPGTLKGTQQQRVHANAAHRRAAPHPPAASIHSVTECKAINLHGNSRLVLHGSYAGVTHEAFRETCVGLEEPQRSSEYFRQQVFSVVAFFFLVHHCCASNQRKEQKKKYPPTFLLKVLFKNNK